MDDSVFVVLDYEKICRLCLNAKGAMSDIFDTSEETPLAHQVALLTEVNVTKDDGLPGKICHKCRYIVELCSELRDTVVKANRLLTDSIDTYSLDEICKSTPSTLKEEYVEEYDPRKEQTENHKSPKVEHFIQKLEQEDGNLLEREEVSQEVRPSRVEEVHASISIEGEAQSSYKKDELRLSKHGNPIKKTTIQRQYARRNISKYLMCQVCLKTFPTKEQVNQHVLTHYQHSVLTPYTEMVKPYHCEECNASLVNEVQLLLHHRKHLNVNPFVCEHPGCSFVGKSKDSLRHHEYTHAARAFVCEACGAAFRRMFELQQHRVRHEDEGASFPCRACRVVCRNRLSYRAHLKFHELGHRFKCDRLGCPKAFYSRNDLQAHQRSHDNDRCYRCHLCISSYVSQSQLNRHLRMHQKRRVNKCDKCCASFDNYAAFYNHRVRTHGPWQPHKCRGCNQGYQTEKQLEKHTESCPLAQNLRQLMGEQPPVSGEGSTGPLHTQTAENEQCTAEIDSLEEELMRRLKGPAVLVQPRDIHSAATENGELHGLPADGLLYIEVDPDPVDPPSAAWEQPS